MPTVAQAEKVSRLLLESDPGQFSEIHDTFVGIFKNSIALQRVLGTLAAVIMDCATSGDDLGMAAPLICALELGYKLRTTEELEELMLLRPDHPTDNYSADAEGFKK